LLKGMIFFSLHEKNKTILLHNSTIILRALIKSTVLEASSILTLA
jgi:hypothetical protein